MVTDRTLRHKLQTIILHSRPDTMTRAVARGSLVDTLCLRAGILRVRFPIRSLDFFSQFTKQFQRHFGPELGSSSKRIDYY
jgi:hypothetical protein